MLFTVHCTRVTPVPVKDLNKLNRMFFKLPQKRTKTNRESTLKCEKLEQNHEMYTFLNLK